MVSSQALHSALGRAVKELLTATEALSESLARTFVVSFTEASQEDEFGSESGTESEDVGTGLMLLTQAYAAREEAFEAVEAAAAGGAAADAATRSMLNRIAELDREMLKSGAAEFGVVRDALQTISKQRCAVAAHQAREREGPRLIAIKA